MLQVIQKVRSPTMPSHALVTLTRICRGFPSLCSYKYRLMNQYCNLRTRSRIAFRIGKVLKMAMPDVHHPAVRSISLPSRVHPTSVKLEAALNHLKAWKTSSVSTTGETIQIGLVGLADLYTCVREIISSPQTQRTLVHYQNGKLVEEALDESVTFLDTCGKGRDVLLTMKGHVQTLQSALRRRRGDSSIETEVAAYINFRKKVKKEVAKCLGALKKIESKFGSSTPFDVDHHLLMVVKVLREASSITISIFQSLLLFLSMPSMKTRVGGWSKISKLIPTRLLSSDKEQKVMNEVGTVDLAFYSINGHFKIGGGMVEVEMVQRTLKTLDASIDGIEAGLDCIFKCLVQNRVTFLDIITHQ